MRALTWITTATLLLAACGGEDGTDGGQPPSDAGNRDAGTDGGNGGQDAGPGTVALGLSPSSHDFGAQPLGASSEPVEFTVQNTGTAAAEVLAIAVEGVDAADFEVIEGDCAGALEPAEQCTLSVSFTPAAPGDRTATLVIDAAGVTASATLTGEGQPQPAITVSPPGEQFFPSTLVGEETTLVFTFTNPAGVPTGILTTTLNSSTGVVDFAVLDDECLGAPLGAGESCAVEVAFHPVSSGDKSAVLTVSGAPGGSASVPLLGHGDDPAAFEISGDTDFGDVGRGGTSQRILTVTNLGTVASDGVNVSISSGAAFFSIVASTCSVSLSPQGGSGDSCQVTVEFHPPSGTSNGSKTGEVTASAPGAVDGTASLWGNAVDPAELVLSPDGDFGAVESDGSFAVQTLTVSNVGGSISGSLSVSLSGSPDFSIEHDGCSDLFLPSGSDCDIDLRVQPPVGARGARTATLTVTSLEGTVTQTLSATALAPAQLQWSGLELPQWPLTQVQSEGALREFVIENVGDLPSGPLTFSGDTSQFTVNLGACGPDGTVVLPGPGTCAVQIRFAPTAGGTFDRALVVTAADGAPSGLPLALQGAAGWSVAVTKNGSSGTGTVTSSPGAISCGTSCSELFPHQTQLTLSTALTPGSDVSWAGCTPVAGSPQSCTLALDGSGSPSLGQYTVNAEIDAVPRTVTVNRTVLGGASGTVTSAVGGVDDGEINCGSGCSSDTGSYSNGTTITLKATPATGFAFSGWTGACALPPNPANNIDGCTLNVTGDLTATATFVPFNRVFVTSTSYTGNIFGVATADTECAVRAAAVSLPGTWRAWLSNTTDHARDRIGASARGWVRVDGLPVIDSLTSAAITPPFFHPITRTESNATPGSMAVWTGTIATGQRMAARCSDWTSSAAGVTGQMGQADAGAKWWTESNMVLACSNFARLYCFQIDYYAPLRPVVPATNAKLAFLSTPYVLGTSSTLTALDAHCASDATNANITGKTWRALVAPTGSTAASRVASVPAATSWYRVDGIKVFDKTGLNAGAQPVAALDVLASGTYTATVSAFTGSTNTNLAGAAADNCSNWTDNTGSARYGATWTTSGSWFSQGNVACSINDRRLYCLEL